MTLSSILTVALAASSVDQVVVYPDRAQVTRVATVACGPRALVNFEGIPPAVDPNSFRAKSSEGLVEGLSGEERTRLKAFEPKRGELEKKLEELDQQIYAQQNAKVRAQLQDRVSQRYGDIAVGLTSREMVEPKPDTKSWSQAFDASLGARLQSLTQQNEADIKLRELQERREDLQRELNELGVAAGRKEYFVEVRVACTAGKQAKVSLTYLVGGASWTPAYEARADESSGSVELSTYATLRQATGEDWKNAQVILSTAVPNQNATPPELNVLRVYVQEQQAMKKVLVAREEVVERADTLSVSTPSAQPSNALQTRAQGLSVQLVVPERADVPGNGEVARLFVGKHKLKATFALKTVPKRLPFVFRVAEAQNSAPFPLLPGPLDAFRRNGFIARYQLDRVPEGGLLKLSFGIEEQVRVKRVTKVEVKKDPNFFSGNRRFNYAYEVEVANFGKDAVEVELSEQVPVSELDDVLVAMEASATAGYALGKDDGIATWKVKLKPAEKRVVNVAFHVDVPGNYDTGNL